MDSQPEYTVPPFASKTSFLILTSTHTLASYIDHVESLDPKDDEKPLCVFTKKWLSRSNADWPSSADPRLHTFMHTNQFYDVDPAHQEDRKELALINNLRHETEVAELQGQPLQYNILRQRVLSRVRSAAEEMIEKKILIRHEEHIQMAKAFKDVWRNRQDYWEKKRMIKEVNSTSTKESDSYDTINLYDAEEDDCVPAALKKKTKTKPKKPISQPKVSMLGCYVLLCSGTNLLR